MDKRAHRDFEDPQLPNAEARRCAIMMWPMILLGMLSVTEVRAAEPRTIKVRRVEAFPPPFAVTDSELTEIDCLCFALGDRELVCGTREVFRLSRKNYTRRRLGSSEGKVFDIAVSDVNRHCAIGWRNRDRTLDGDDTLGQVQVFNLATNAEVFKYEMPLVREISLAFSDDGQRLFAGLGYFPDDIGNHDDSGYAIWNCRDYSLHRRAIFSDKPTSSMSHNARWIAIQSSPTEVNDNTKEGEFAILDAVSGKVKGHYSFEGISPYRFEFSRDDDWLAVQLSRYDIGIWSVPEFRRQATIRAEYRDGPSVRFHHRGKVCAVVTEQGEVLLFEVASGKKLTQIAAKKGVTSICFSNISDLLAIGYSDGTVEVWNVEVTEPTK